MEVDRYLQKNCRWKALLTPRNSLAHEKAEVNVRSEQVMF